MIEKKRWMKLAGIITETKSCQQDLDEGQFAVDPFDGHPERDYNGPDYDPEQNPEIQDLPKQIGSPQDDEFSLDDFDPEDEDLSMRSQDYYENSDDEGLRPFDYDDKEWIGMRGLSPEDREEREQKVVDASRSTGSLRSESRKHNRKRKLQEERVESADELQRELQRLIREADDIFDLLLAGKTKYDRKLMKKGRRLLRNCSQAVHEATFVPYEPMNKE